MVTARKARVRTHKNTEYMVEAVNTRIQAFEEIYREFEEYSYIDRTMYNEVTTTFVDVKFTVSDTQ